MGKSLSLSKLVPLFVKWESSYTVYRVAVRICESHIVGTQMVIIVFIGPSKLRHMNLLLFNSGKALVKTNLILPVLLDLSFPI